LEHDAKYWKVPKLFRKKQDFDSIDKIITVRFSDLKEIFNAATITYMTPPDFTKGGFLRFCKDAGITDSNIHSGIIDTYFKATNYEAVQQV